MLKAGDELGDALNGDCSEKEKAEKFGKAAIMLLLAAGAMYGSMAMVMQPKMLRSIVTESKSAIGQTFADIKSLVQIFTIQDADSMLLYCEEFVSSPALQTLKEAVKGCNVKQLHEMAKMIREASKKIERALTGDELAAALNNWRENGSITKAVQAAYEWFRNISTYKVRNTFQHLLQQILDRYEITLEEFNHLRLKKVENLNDREVKVLKAIREAIPKGDNNTYVQKVLSAEDIPKYLGEDGYSAIRGFISKYDDVSHIKTYDDVVESFRLDYVSKGKRPFPEGGDTYGYIKFKTDDVENIGIPFGKKMGGTNTDAPPCTLNGFTGARNGEIIAEWYVKEGTNLTPINGSELHRVVNGIDTIIAIYQKDHFIEVK